MIQNSIILTLFLLLTACDGDGGAEFNSAPCFTSGNTANISENQTRAMKVTARDAEGDSLTFGLTGNIDGALFNINPNTGGLSFNSAPDFEAPADNGGDNLYNVKVSVSDGRLSVDQNLLITVTNVDEAPTSNAGIDQTVDAKTIVTLSGTGIDPDGAIVYFSWVQLSGTVVEINGANAATATFSAPAVDADEVLQFELLVTDNGGKVARDSIIIAVRQVNEFPVVDAGIDQTVDEKTTVTLSGSGIDTDGSIVDFSWVQLSGTVVEINEVNVATTTFTAPAVDADEVLQFELSVTDNGGRVARDSIIIAVRQVNELPLADAGNNQIVDEQTDVELSAIGTDFDGSIVSYNWVQIAGTSVILIDANTPVVTFVSPGVVLEETLIFQLTVIDNEGGNGTDEVEVVVVFVEDNDFNYSQELFDIAMTLFIMDIDKDNNTGVVSVNGGDTRPVSKAFNIDWGDGTPLEDQWFPFFHTYNDTGRNYKMTVLSNYNDGTSNTLKALVQFSTFGIDPAPLPDELQVRIPSEKVVLESRLYSVPTNLTTFDDSFFTLTPRNVLEYLLTVAATIQMEAVNDNVFLVDGSFRQVVLRDADFGGAYSLWFTSPVSFASGDYFFQNIVGYSALLHEMGHNFSLNSPAEFHYGGRIDGSANAIYSESIARIFQYSTGYQIMNNLKTYNIHEDLAYTMESEFRASANNLRLDYDKYISEGSPYSSWNDPLTQIDETFGTFSVISYKFVIHAEQSNKGYIFHLKRMMCLLQQFDVEMHEAYNQSENTLEADAFRATLLVTALSYAFDKDLRQEFTDLNFPIDNNHYEALLSGVPFACAD